jgi:hypothetical protein
MTSYHLSAHCPKPCTLSTLTMAFGDEWHCYSPFTDEASAELPSTRWLKVKPGGQNFPHLGHASLFNDLSQVPPAKWTLVPCVHG